MGASGVGALISAGWLAARQSVLGLGGLSRPWRVSSGRAYRLLFSRLLWLSLLLMVVTGFGMMQQMAASNTVLQTIADEDKRGRVMSFYSMAFQGMAPFGSLFAGMMASRRGAFYPGDWRPLLCRRRLVVYRQTAADSRLVRPIYRKLGILPEIADGMQAATALQVPPEN